MSERRITRSISTEHQARPAAAQPPNPPQNSHIHYNGYIKGLSGLIHDAENSFKDTHLASMHTTSDDILIKSLVEGIPAPSMEGIGFANIPQTGRIDSEELFHSWMSLGEGQTPGQLHRPRQSYSRRSKEMAFLLSQQSHEIPNAAENIDQYLQTNNFFLEDAAGENKARNVEGQGVCATESSHLKWFSQNRPMTRSHSSELRRRYAAMQGSSPALTDHGVKQMSGATEGLENRKFHQLSYPQFPQSTLSPIRGHLGGESISSFVTLLKGTLERKRMGKGNSQQQRWPQFSGTLPNMVQGSQNQIHRSSQQRGLSHSTYEGHEQVQSFRQTVMEAHVHNVGAGFTGNNQHQQQGLPSHTRSPSESSVGAPVLSTGEDPCNSGQTTPLKRPAKDVPDFDHQPKRQNSITTNYSADNGEAVKETHQIVGEKKLPHLARMASVTSSGGSGIMVVKEDPTKKRRVERQRKMAEAKGRSAVPMTPSEFQATVKRCDALEKEVRSLKLNLAFMNRKDSEQTKQIEDLQKQNEELQEEKEKLLEEIEQLTSRARVA
ncbi:hypothetical protein GOP47_0019748 [Adiantum capillus-veneris]|uniref:Protein CYCLOPS n=1 Tax=Adiantum capillus-veneris TaxID=13818 RepID=A0A9D4UBM1_ADICA|nr:hypothetical protein GOP47_0019748 [Adiantum capillus-veneris]